jgi:ribonucleoside-diphosphate reductase alpha subunit
MSAITSEMYVIKRDGSHEPVSFDKVLERCRKAASGLSVNYTRLAQLVLAEIHDEVRTMDLDEIAARLSISYMTTHPDWATLAAQIIISNCQRSTPRSFSEAMEILAGNVDTRGAPAPALAADVIAFIRANAAALDAMVVPENDFLLDYFGFKTLEKGYLLRSAGRVIETPQYMWLRVAVGLWGASHDGAEISLADRMEGIRLTYTLMSQKAFTHATPTLFNAGTPRPQCSSCFLLSAKSDSIEGIFDTLKECALISKHAGGIGLHVHNIRAQGTPIAGTQGISNGLVPMLRVFNNTARYVDQCFAPDTLIVTRNGEKRIADIEPGDEVLTSGCTESVEEGVKHYVHSTAGPTWCRVSKRVDHLYSGTMYRIKTTLMSDSDPAIQVSEDHPFLAKRGNAYDNDYVEVKNLKVGDKMFRPTLGDVDVREIEPCAVENMTLYDLEVEGTHDYLVANAGFAHNGGGKRNGSFAIYLEPWHADIQAFLKMKSNTGSEEDRARDLFYALWIPDLFMRRVESGGDWSLFCPHEAPGLADVHGAAFVELYERYEREGRARRSIPAQKLWSEILVSQIETGTPYLLYKDAANAKSNQQNLGTIKSSNLCTEILEFSSPEETAVCNLASIALPFFVATDNRSFDFTRLREVTFLIVNNLNRVIDINYYPTPETRKSNMRHRPVGIGVQGLADVFARLGLAWETPAAAALNQEIFENIYYAALEASTALAETDGPYETFVGSPASEGKLQPDLWGIDPTTYKTAAYLDWAALRARVTKFGLRNSLLVAPMPTASTSQILGYNECIEPFTTNIYVRRTLAGEFTVINKYLIADLMGSGLWNAELKDRIVAANGSVQAIPEIPTEVKERYKTVWEIKQKTLIDMAADRGAFICQSQSLNLFVADPTIAKLSSMHFYAWKRGLKTGIYYLRTKSAVQAIKFTIDPRLAAGGSSARLAEVAASVGSAQEPSECLLCSA